MKHCKDCRAILSDLNWFPSLQKKGTHLCKKCNSARSLRWRKKNPEKHRAAEARVRAKMKLTKPNYQRDWSRTERAKRRMEMIEAYGGRCAHCGISDPLVLDIDHINDDGGRKSGALWGWRLYRWLRKYGWPKDRFQLLCRNCNWRKEMLRREQAKSPK